MSKKDNRMFTTYFTFSKLSLIALFYYSERKFINAVIIVIIKYVKKKVNDKSKCSNRIQMGKGL